MGQDASSAFHAQISEGHAKGVDETVCEYERPQVLSAKPDIERAKGPADKGDGESTVEPLIIVVTIAKEETGKKDRQSKRERSAAEDRAAAPDDERAEKQFLKEGSVRPDQSHDAEIGEQIALHMVKAAAGADVLEELVGDPATSGHGADHQGDGQACQQPRDEQIVRPPKTKGAPGKPVKAQQKRCKNHGAQGRCRAGVELGVGQQGLFDDNQSGDDQGDIKERAETWAGALQIGVLLVRSELTPM